MLYTFTCYTLLRVFGMNNIKKIRQILGWTQAELAERAGTSQQNIQRIEAGSQNAKLDLAIKICVALDKSMAEVFPKSEKAFLSALERGTPPEELVSDLNFCRDLSSSGVENVPIVHSITVYLKGGVIRNLPVSTQEDFRRIRSSFNEEINRTSFVVFDSWQHRIALNKNQVVACQFLFDPGRTLPVPDDDQAVEILTPDFAEPIKIKVDADTAAFDQDEDEDVTLEDIQLQSAFSDAEDAEFQPGEFSSLIDEDGEDVLIRWDHVTMFSVPLALCEPAMFLNDDEDDEDDEAEQHEERL